MTGSFVSLVVVILALTAGLALGLLLGSRPAADLRARLAASEAESREREEQTKLFVRDLAAMSERLKIFDDEAFGYEAIRGERDLLRTENATLREKSANFEEQKAGLLKAQESLKTEFEASGAKILAQAQEALLNRAQERFSQSEEKNEARIKALLEPVGAKLASYEAQVGKIEKDRVDAFGQLNGQIEAMRAGQELVRAEAARLGNSLRNAPKTRGQWGEQQLRNVLEQCGLSEHTDFITEHSVQTEDGRLRPDAIVKIPGNKQLVIDSKVSLNHYQDAFEEVDEAKSKVSMEKHAAAMRNHVQQLSAKSYHSQFENAPDYVVMFVPGEHFITAAIDQDTKLWDYAFERRVLIASPTNLVAIARTISQVWQQDGLAKEARDIGKLASDLYDSLAKTQDDLSKVGIHLGRAVNSFNDFTKTYDGNVLSRARRLTEKHIKIGKREISDEVAFIEASARSITGAVPALSETESAEGGSEVA